MTKKDYVLIANTLWGFYQTALKSNKIEKQIYLTEIAEAFCFNLKEENPRFNKVKFTQAVFN